MGEPIITHPKKTKKPSAEEVLALLLENCNRIREWYRKQPGTGQPINHHTAGELNMGDMASALEAAMAGRRWEPL
ncbi:MAG: hypothetical protein JSR30_00170 [Proteobacteria bacterium]|nr:hypothetical protein [Pseudomonadota bacterium]